MIKYTNLGNTDVKVSRIALGCGFRGLFDINEAASVIDQAIDLGINFVDCANIYKVRSGEQSELALGKALAGRRDKVVITSKFGSFQQVNAGEVSFGRSREIMFRAVENSLKRLGTDYIDFYFLHSQADDVPMEETIEAFDTLRRQGKIRYYGLSNHNGAEVADALDIARKNGLYGLSILQNPYNLLNRHLERELEPIVRREKLGLMTYSPVATGLLGGAFSRGKPIPEKSTWGYNEMYREYFKTFFPGKVESIVNLVQDIADDNNVSSAAVAAAWVLRNDAVTACIAGSDSIEELKGSLEAFNVEIPSDQLAELDKLSEGMEEFLSIDKIMEKFGK
ncbi:MAG: aldo/keto reductase [Spirochaetales bacterium]|nr:aldo/keto reductase [Spirochaetales bacterium]